MHYGLSRRVFMLGIAGYCVLIGIFVFHCRERPQHEALLPILRSYGFWDSEAIFSSFPFAYDEDGRPNGLFVRIRPGATGTLRTTYFQSATDEATVREFPVNADPKFEFFLSIIDSSRPIPRSSEPRATLLAPGNIDPDGTSRSVGWLASAAWSATYNVTWASNEILFTGDSMQYPLCSIIPTDNAQKPCFLVAAFYLVPHGQTVEAPVGEDMLQVMNYCKGESVDAIAIEYLPDSGG
jgi:hypothetical protein